MGTGWQYNNDNVVYVGEDDEYDGDIISVEAGATPGAKPF